MSVTLDRRKTPHERLSEIVRNHIVRGLFAQIGLGTGDYAHTILKSAPKEKLFIIVDPYGSYEYRMMSPDELGYPSTKTARSNGDSLPILQELYQTAVYKDTAHFLYYPMDDAEFYERFQTGIFFYNESEKIKNNEYGFVLFNAENCVGNLIEGIRFMNERTPKDGVWVFNNINEYNARQRTLLDELVQECNMEPNWENDFLVATKLIDPLDCLKPEQEAYAENEDKILIANTPSDTNITYH